MSSALALRNTMKPTSTSTTCAPTQQADLLPLLPPTALSSTQMEAPSSPPPPPPHPPPQQCLSSPGRQGSEILPSTPVHKAVIPRRAAVAQATPLVPAARIQVCRWEWSGWIWVCLWRRWWVWSCLDLCGHDDPVLNVDRWPGFLFSL